MFLCGLFMKYKKRVHTYLQVRNNISQVINNYNKSDWFLWHIDGNMSTDYLKKNKNLLKKLLWQFETHIQDAS